MSGITEEVFEQIHSFQHRCIKCGGTLALEVHHRVFRSEGEKFLLPFLIEQSIIYEIGYDKRLKFWHLHDVQNLCVLCNSCHNQVHNGNENLRLKLRYSFTHPQIGFSIPYNKIKTLY